MNKSTLLVLCSVVVAMTARAQPLKTDRDFDRLKGKVHQVSHGNQMPSMQDKSHSGESETYDKQGNLIASVEVGADSYLRHTYVHLDPKTVLEYWDEDPAIPENRADASHLSAKYVYKYDGNGNRIERSDFDKKGTPTFQHKYLYDSKGRRISESTEVGKEVRDLVKFIYNKEGNVITQTSGSQKTTYRYIQFDSSGNWTKRIVSALGIKEGESEPTMQNIPEERFITYY
jgi:YD repeat-containing protein